MHHTPPPLIPPFHICLHFDGSLSPLSSNVIIEYPLNKPTIKSMQSGVTVLLIDPNSKHENTECSNIKCKIFTFKDIIFWNLLLI